MKINIIFERNCSVFFYKTSQAFLERNMPHKEPRVGRSRKPPLTLRESAGIVRKPCAAVQPGLPLTRQVFAHQGCAKRQDVFFRSVSGKLRIACRQGVYDGGVFVDDFGAVAGAA